MDSSSIRPHSVGLISHCWHISSPQAVAHQLASLLKNSNCFPRGVLSMTFSTGLSGPYRVSYAPCSSAAAANIAKSPTQPLYQRLSTLSTKSWIFTSDHRNFSSIPDSSKWIHAVVAVPRNTCLLQVKLYLCKLNMLFYYYYSWVGFTMPRGTNDFYSQDCYYNMYNLSQTF